MRDENPLFAAIDDLAEFDAAADPETADAEIERRMRRLRLAVAALSELSNRDDDVTPTTLETEMERLEDEFVFHPRQLLEVAELLREDGMDERAAIVERAYAWMAHRYMPDAES